MRRAEVVPIRDELGCYLELLAATLLPKTLLGGAMHDAIGQWTAIRPYTAVARAEDGYNSCEQTLWVPVLGRKNWTFIQCRR
ncbi:MAG: transposase [Candidatus Binatia bacterium]